MSSSDYQNDAHDAHQTTAVEEYHGQPSSGVRSPEHYYSAGEEKAVEYPSFPEPQLPSHSPHLDQTMFQNYDNENKVAFPMPYSHEKESEKYHNDATASDTVYESYQKESMTDKEDYNHASTYAAIYAPNTEDNVAASDDVQVPESAQVNDSRAAMLSEANGEGENKEHLVYPSEEEGSVNIRDTLIGEEEHKDEKVALSDEQANEAQRLEDERRLKTKMEEETKDRVFQPETEPEAVYVPSIKPRSDVAEQNCCWGCLAWICCWTSAASDKK
ncbi:UDP-N-acetylglucosamine pyrophosphorylase [Mucor velutinosus]|uniref:UDP-N-acetylglucosamine pyrophosphorylase n=1 Tax=Mucor velutinosus TaxID=708070 RepID=A0AAN7HYM7_9FUNG|nr:UDP-N-acetylglucosamine pyrophosphorylase [Mucor velutinosus]